MKNMQENNLIHHTILDNYKKVYGVCLTNTMQINHLTQWVLNELLTNVLHLDGLSASELIEHYPSELTIESDWKFVKSSYLKLLDTKKQNIQNYHDAINFVDEWNEILQDFRWERKNSLVIKSVQDMLAEEDFDISDESSIEDFFFYVKHRIANELFNH